MKKKYKNIFQLYFDKKILASAIQIEWVWQ